MVSTATPRLHLPTYKVSEWIYLENKYSEFPFTIYHTILCVITHLEEEGERACA